MCVCVFTLPCASTDRYEERLRYIQTITNNKVLSSYEEFCERVMHPLEMGSSQSLATSYSASALRASPHKPLSSVPAASFTSLLRSFALTSHHHRSPVSSTARQSHPSSSHPHLNLPRRSETFLKSRTSHEATPPRPRSSTNEDRIVPTPEPLRTSKWSSSNHKWQI